MSYYVDAHCHLDLLENIQTNWINEDLLPIKTICVTNAPFIYEPCKKLFANSKNLRVALGLHPELVTQYATQVNLFENLIDTTKYIGEIGLDGSTRFNESFEIQKKVFIEILSLCKKRNNKILTIHTRNAVTEMIDLLDSHLQNSNCKVIFHWYSGNQNDLNQAIERGYYFSINHKMVSSKKGKEIVTTIPNYLLLTETDAPFTFDNNLKSRLESLKSTIDGISKIKNEEFFMTKDRIYNNFKLLLNSIK